MAQLVGEPCDQRCLRPDDHQVGAELAGERHQRRLVVGAHGMAVGKRRDPRVAGSGMQLVEVAAAGEGPDKRVLATSRSDHQRSHRRIVIAL